MISISENISNMLSAPARRIQARVELYECSTLQNDNYNRVLLDIFPSSGALKDFKVERTATDGKFFGFGVSQKLTVNLRDKDRLINVEKGQVLEIAFGVEEDYTYPCPLFRVEEVSRNESNNDLTITAYDFLYKAGEHRVSELAVTEYTIRSFVYACADVLNLPVKFDVSDSAFDLSYPSGANFDGAETLREALNAVAEATQTIYFVDWDWRLTFKRLEQSGNPVLTIDKSKYFELTNKSDRTLTTICHATELGDNVEATTGAPGVTQYVRENPFWDMRDDIDTLLSNALTAIAGMTISQFDCSWRGNFALEIGDKINLVTKDDGILEGYVLNDTITYNGGLKEQTFWNFTEHTAETAANPITLTDALKQTYAKVDKANKQIDLFVSDVQANSEAISRLQMTTDSISATVSEVQETTTSAIDGVNEELATLTNKVEATMTAEDVTIAIKSELSNGTHKVETETGFTFNEDGLTVSKSGSEMTTTITEDGMTVYKNDEAVLVADNEGVKAEDLHATTYLIIGKNSRFEDFGDRTACFWIGS